MEFNQKLQELRRQRGITQEELASELYVSRTAISKWELGKGYPSIDSLKAISKYFKASFPASVKSFFLRSRVYFEMGNSTMIMLLSPNFSRTDFADCSSG